MVFAQCMHYAAVLHVLPRLVGAPPSGSPPSGAPSFVLATVVLTLVLLALFAYDFKEGRSWYGLAAAVHAWVELPILLLAFGSPNRGLA